jgi:methyltransferase (TIGR00027 family)
MEAGQPSRTAFGAALHRAAHQLLDSPLVLVDPLAVRIVGAEAAEALRTRSHAHVVRTALRAFIVARSRFTEDSFVTAYERGVRQYVVLGAGLDTFAYRAPSEGLRVYEVDHPTTQAWRRELLARAGISEPVSLTFVPVDFEREALRDKLAAWGFDAARPAFFAWLGVTPYLTREAILKTLGLVATLARGSEIVFDYAEPAENLSPLEEAARHALAERVALAGEPFQPGLRPDELASDLRRLGYSVMEDFTSGPLNERYFAGRSDGFELRGRSHVMRAMV